MLARFGQAVSHKGRLLAALVLAGALHAAPALAMSDPVGIWTMSQDGGTRQCRLQLRDDILGAGRAIAMPPGCHRAFPVLNGVRTWVQVDDAHVSFNNDADAAVLLFEDDGTGRLHALGPEGTDAYTLTAAGGRARSAAAAAPDAAGSAPPAEAPAPVVVLVPKAVAPTLTPSAVAGHYAVMRGSRDTGCMVTLEEPMSRSGAPLKARLAPACRDQGIMVFDPVAWQLKAGHLVLTARKGHTADLDRDETGMWVKTGKSPAPLGLKRL